jgi:hypothetical protein
MPTITATDTSMQCSIANNSGKDIALLILIESDETISSDAIQIANGSLEVLKTTDGDIIIKDGASGTVTLDQGYNPDSGQSGEIKNYDLIVSDSAWLYPIGLLSASQQAGSGVASCDNKRSIKPHPQFRNS